MPRLLPPLRPRVISESSEVIVLDKPSGLRTEDVLRSLVSKGFELKNWRFWEVLICLKGSLRQDLKPFRIFQTLRCLHCRMFLMVAGALLVVGFVWNVWKAKVACSKGIHPRNSFHDWTRRPVAACWCHSLLILPRTSPNNFQKQRQGWLQCLLHLSCFKLMLKCKKWSKRYSQPQSNPIKQ